MPRTPKRPRDLNQWAKRMVDIATGEANDREPTPEEQGKDPDPLTADTGFSATNNAFTNVSFGPVIITPTRGVHEGRRMRLALPWRRAR